MSTIQHPQLILSELTLERVPHQPAVYAILSDGQAGSTTKRCRYVGHTDNLWQAILQHFQPYEPNVLLRYFMLSSKLKYLQYELVPAGDTNTLFNRTEEWMEEFNMISPTEEKEEIAQFSTV